MAIETSVSNDFGRYWPIVVTFSVAAYIRCEYIANAIRLYICSKAKIKKN